MHENYDRDLDLNLLRVFVLVAELGSVTAAADRLYLTQPAVSAALRRLNTAVGSPLLMRHGRRLVLTARGTQLLARARPHLASLIDAVRSPAAFSPAESQRTIRLGLSDAAESWLLPGLLSALADEAPRMTIIVSTVQFRTVGDALASRAVDMAVTVADDLPSAIERQAIYQGTFACLFDPRRTRIGRRLTEKAYFAHEHVLVSYNADTRGVIEDVFRKQRRVRCSVPSFSHIGAIIDGTALLATVPDLVVRSVRATRPHLRAVSPPFTMDVTPLELLWPRATHDDEACRFVRERIIALGAAEQRRAGTYA